MRLRQLPMIGFAIILTGCANHPVDCAVGFHHPDCLPGTAGYDDPDRFAVVDDMQCRSYGLMAGTKDYADCRIKISAGRNPGVFQ